MIPRLVMPVSFLYTLPWPPSANRYYRHLSKGPLAGRSLISKAGRVFREDAVRACGEQGCPLQPLAEPVRVEVHANPPDARRRDLDNLLKPTMDALTHAGVLADDSWVKQLYIEMGERAAPLGVLTVLVLPITRKEPAQVRK